MVGAPQQPQPLPAGSRQPQQPSCPLRLPRPLPTSQVDGLKAKVDGLRAKASQGDPKAQKSLEDATKQLQVQEGQLTSE